MTTHSAKSFEEVAFQEAAARRVRVSLLVKPVREGDDRQLAGRLLGCSGPNRLALAIPTRRSGEKVYVPEGWPLGMSFAVGNLFIQAHSTVEAHGFYRTFPTKRVDALLIRRPQRVISVIRRQEMRYEPAETDYFLATIWAESELLSKGRAARSREGRMVNWSRNGMGVRLSSPLPFDPDSSVVVRVEHLAAGVTRFYQGTFKHCSPLHEGGNLAGFGDVVEIQPGQQPDILEALAQQAP